MGTYSIVGDTFHYVTLTSAFAFAFAVSKEAPIFDEQWKRDGFCVTNSDEPYWSSHDVCLYVDIVASVLLGLMYYSFYKQPGLEMANMYVFTSIPGIVAHGLGHGGIGAVSRNSDWDATSEIEKTGWQLAMEHSANDIGMFVRLLPLLLFWLGMGYSSMPNLKKIYVPFISVLATIATLSTKRSHNFTVVQTILFLLFSIDQLFSSKKNDWAYAAFPIIVGFPVTLVGWMESTQCQNFVRDRLYGHVVYDSFIPVSIGFFYLLSYLRAKSLVHSKEKSA